MGPTRAVVTVVIGEEWRKVAEVTVPTHKAYAERLGATFLAVTRPLRPASEAAYEKWRLYHALSLFDRAVFLDADALVRHDCPDLFLAVPPDCVGGFDELPGHPAQARHLADFCAAAGLPSPPCTHYLNTGVMVLSACHRDLFAEPESVPAGVPWPEQSHFNARLLARRVPTCCLPWQFNCMHAMQQGDYLRHAFVVHYSVRDMAQRRAEAARDLSAWAEMGR